MMEQGAAPAIIGLAASSHNRLLRTECMEALCKLAVVPGSEAQIVAEVCVASLAQDEKKRQKTAPTRNFVRTLTYSSSSSEPQGNPHVHAACPTPIALGELH